MPSLNLQQLSDYLGFDIKTEMTVALQEELGVALKQEIRDEVKGMSKEAKIEALQRLITS